jgi:tRNA pseudouridine55 synthase
VLNVRKESGWTSHDVVARLKRLSSQKRVGHAGTLDPLAEGVLPVLLGRATRLADLLQHREKEYVARVALGAETATDDCEGEVTREAAVPDLTRSLIENALQQFLGEIDQVPPAYSAIKIQGRKAYAVARAGGSIDLPPRRVRIDSLRLVHLAKGELELEVRCSRGTYVRSLARDLGRALDTAAHLSGLMRSRVGDLRVEDALTPAEIEARGIEECLLPVDTGLGSLPRVDLAAAALDVLHGRPIPTDLPPADAVRVYDERGHMIAVAASLGGKLTPRIVLEDP